MRTPPPIENQILRELVESSYDITVEHLNFVPKGEAAHGFRLSDGEGRSYYLKVYGPTRMGQIGARRLGFTMSLAHALHHKYGITEVQPPIRTKEGRFSVSLDPVTIVLLPYIEGRTIEESGFHMTAEEHQALAELLARIHSTPIPETPHPNAFETFDCPWLTELLIALTRLDMSIGQTTEQMRALRELVISHRQRFLKEAARIEELMIELSRRRLPSTCIHTDPTAGNVIVAPDGKLHLIDWDEARIGAIEQDLWFFLEEHIADFMPEYRKRRPETKLDPDLVEFCVRGRILADLTDWVVRIMNEQLDDEQFANDMEGIQRDCIDAVDMVDTRVKAMRANQEIWA